MLSSQERSISLGLIGDPPLDLQTMRLEPGTLVLAYTDGVTEAMNKAGEQFGRERLEAAVPALQGQSAQHICARIVDVVDTHLGEAQ